MTERRPDLDDARLHGDLATWFDGEVRQAALDLRRAPLRPARARRASAPRTAAPAAGAILVTILVIAGITRLPSLTSPATEPTASASPTGSSVGPAPTATIPAATSSPVQFTSIARRFGDGIPELIDGMQVFRPSSVDHFALDYDRPFLLGGWSRDFSHIIPSCALQVGTPPPFGVRCGNPFLSEDPLGGQVAPVFLVGWTPDIGAGPVVVRVHRHDPMAATCEPARRGTCDAMAVIEDVVWTGDEMTATAPLVPIDVFARLAAIDPDLSRAILTPIGQVPPISISVPTFAPPSGVTWSGLPRCDSPIPMMTWFIAGSRVSYVVVFPSNRQREAAEPSLQASRFGCFVILDALHAREWVAVDNVMIAVNVDHEGPTPAQAAFVEEVREALERR